MIAELVINMSTMTGGNSWEMTNQSVVFPEPAKQIGGHQELRREISNERTFSLNPEEGAVCHPIGEHAAIEKPRGGVMVHIARAVVVCGRIRWI